MTEFKAIEAATGYDHRLIDPAICAAPEFDAFTCANEYGLYCVPRSFGAREVPKVLSAGDVYEPKTLAFLRRAARGGDIVSGGAFIGDFFPALSEALGKDALLHSFEPNPISFAAALRTIGLNNLKNVMMGQVAVGEKAAMLPLQVSRGAKTAMAARARLVQNADADNTIEVPVVTLDQMIPVDREVKVVHLDIEGHEMQAIIGAKALIRRCQPIIVLEAAKSHRRKSYARALEKLCPEAGYQLGGVLERNAIYVPHG